MKQNPETRRKYRLTHKKEISDYYNNHKKKYSETNKRWCKNNPERRKEHKRRYNQTETGKATAQRANTRRRANLQKITNTLTAHEWENILEKYNYICAYCGVEFDCENLPTRDHIIPISKGGNNTKENIIPACRSCNSKKFNRHWGKKIN